MQKQYHNNGDRHNLLPVTYRKIKKAILWVLLMCQSLVLYAGPKGFEELILTGIENPIYVTLSPDGLKMIIIDWPRKGYPVLKQLRRSSVKSTWDPATAINEINSKLSAETNIKSVSFTWDNRFLLFSANFSGGAGGFDIYSSEIGDKGYGDPVNIGPPINTPADENYPSVSGNSRSFLFTRNIEMNKIRHLDPGAMWISTADGMTGQWKEPEKINIILNDAGVGYLKMYDDNKTLFYSRVDDKEKIWKIHWAKRIGDIHWYLPVKLDTLNKSDNEISPAFCRQDGYLYFIKCGDMGSRPKGTLFRFKADEKQWPDPTVLFSGSVRDTANKIPLNANVLVTDPVLGRVEFFTRADIKEGKWETLLVADKMYMFHLWKDQYSHHYQLFNASETKTGKSFHVKLTPSVDLSLNIYDKEELWPLDANVGIWTGQQKTTETTPVKIRSGMQRMTLPIGADYTIMVSKKDYEDTKINLDLSAIVLFDKFMRDVELTPNQRKLEILVAEKGSLKPLSASIEITDQRKKRFTPAPVQGMEGLYETLLREGEKYDFEVRGPKYYAFKHIMTDLDQDRNLKRLIIELDPLSRKVPLRLENISFEFNSADLLENSFPELDRVVQLLRDNPDIYVEISAHTCDIGSDRFNDVLSDKRARSVVHYMSLKGISSRRMSAKGYGEKFPLAPNDNEDLRALNRRVELKILDENDEIFQIDEKIQE